VCVYVCVSLLVGKYQYFWQIFWISYCWAENFCGFVDDWSAAKIEYAIIHYLASFSVKTGFILGHPQILSAKILINDSIRSIHFMKISGYTVSPRPINMIKNKCASLPYLYSGNLLWGFCFGYFVILTHNLHHFLDSYIKRLHISYLFCI